MNKILKYGCGCLFTILAIGIVLLGLVFYIWINAEETGYSDCPKSDEDFFNTPQKIEKLSGIKLPEFDIIKYAAGPEDFFGDNSDSLYVSFRSANIDSLRRELSMIKGLQVWSDSCKFEYFSNVKDYGISVILNKETNNGIIIYFTW